MKANFLNLIIVSFIFASSCLGLFSCSGLTNENLIYVTSIYTGEYRPLINALSKEDTTEITRIARTKNLALDYADSINGVSLLNWCIFNKKESSFKVLLLLGANPNWQDSTYQFPPAITEAARVDYTSDFLKLALEYGGNPNQLSKGLQGTEQQSPLFSAIYSNRLENIQLLLNKGADVNLRPDSLWTPLAEAALHKKIVSVKYLLDDGADYRSLHFKTMLGVEMNILDFLRDMQFPFGSKEHETKMQVVSYLKSKGLNYWTYPIPEKVKEQNKLNEAYLSKY